MSKFRIWVDDSNLDKVMGFDQFDTDTQRQAGFTGGTPASSIRVNTALRQANLVACALMNIVDSGNTADFRSSVATVQSLLSNYISNTMVAYKATNADTTNLNTGNNAVVNFKIGNGTAYNKTVNNVANVTTSINNQNLNNIFESNGTTVKQSTNAKTIQNVDFSSSTSSAIFGDYLISKRRNLLTSEVFVPAGNKREYDIGKTIPAGGTFEVLWGLGANGPHMISKAYVYPSMVGETLDFRVYGFSYADSSEFNICYGYVSWKRGGTSFTFESGGKIRFSGSSFTITSEAVTYAKITQIIE